MEYKMEKSKSIMDGKGEWDEEEHPRDKDGKFTNKNGEEKKVDKQKTKVKTFEEQVDEVLSGTYKDHHITICEETPKPFQEIGIKKMPFLMTTKHAYLVINEKGKYARQEYHYHGLGKELFLLIPKLLQSPMMILQPKDKDDELIVLLNWFDKNKNVLIMPLKLNGKGNKNFVRVDAHIAKSVYGKDNLRYYINKNFTQDDILFAANKKIRNLRKPSS